MPIPFDQIPVGEGLLPDGTRAPFFVDGRELRILHEQGPAWKYHDARFIEEAVADPDVIFEGLRRPNQTDAFCYSVRPLRDPDEEEDSTSELLPPVWGQVFLAFARLGPMGYLVFDWEWRPEGAEPGHPEDGDTDFERIVWQRP